MHPFPKIINTLSYFFSHASEFLFPSPDLPHEFAHLPAAATDSLPPGTDALFAYRDEQVKLLVWEIKYHKNERAADDVGKLLAERIVKKLLSDCSVNECYANALRSNKKVFLVPIPLTARRLRERGFNHTEMLARATMKFLPAHFVLANNVLIKIRHTAKQASLADRTERLHNMSNAFMRAPETTEPRSEVSGNLFVIIDDVITTGATVSAARLPLEEAGAKTIAIALAH